MQRNDDLIEQLLALQPQEQKRFIATLAEKKVDLYVCLIKNILSQTGKTTSNDSNKVINELLVELIERKSNIVSEWKNEVTFLLYSLNNKPNDKILASEGKTLGEARDNITFEILENHKKISNDFKETLDEIKSLKTLLAEKENNIIEQKKLIDSTLAKTDIELQNKDKQIDGILSELAELKKKMADDPPSAELKVKNDMLKKINYLLDNKNELLAIELNNMKRTNSDLKSQLQGKYEMQPQITCEALQAILKKYENRKYKFFSHAPTIVNNLKSLYTEIVVTKLQVQSCLIDPDHLFDSPPISRGQLTNREKLICDLADAFNNQADNDLAKRITSNL